MKKIISIVKYSVLVVLFTISNSLNVVNAGISSNDLGLCPDDSVSGLGYTQGLVSTGFVDCYGDSSNTSQRADAEIDRLQLEALCNANPRSEVTSSEVRQTPSGGAFFAEVTCTVTRVIPPGTVLCPDNSDEVLRAFDTLVCKYFGSAATTAGAAQTELGQQTAQCAAATGRVIASSIKMESAFDGDDNEIPFFFGSLACGITIDPTDIIECPYSYFELDRDENLLECQNREAPFDSLAESQEVNDAAQAICTGTTGGLGSVSDADATLTTSDDRFVSVVNCDIRIPRYGDFTDQAILRACDASCTEEVEQSRVCLNGGVIGGVGCSENSTQIIERTCNTGPDIDGLCPLVFTPATVLPFLLEEDEDE